MTSHKPAALQCDACGRFIPYADFEKGAVNRMVTPDSDYSREEYETLCITHAPKRKATR